MKFMIRAREMKKTGMLRARIESNLVDCANQSEVGL